jgi:hypothetical protein
MQFWQYHQVCVDRGAFMYFVDGKIQVCLSVFITDLLNCGNDYI